MSLVFFLLRALLRAEWLAGAVPVLALAIAPSGLTSGQEWSWIAAVFAVVGGVTFLLVLMRVGLLALISVGFFQHFLESMLTTDFSAWYADNSLFVLLVLAVLASFAFRTAIAGQSLFSGARLDG